VIYTVIGLIVSLIFGPDALNYASTHWITNVIFFIIFVIFALSFFGLFEITLPSSFVNKVDAQSDKGGYYGVFFMAFTIVLVSFSCTGPIVASILLAAAQGEVLKPTLGMFGFSLAFALPFTLFAIFPGWLHGLPKSGGWLNAVKVVLGFIELALAFKFLSVADQVYHWGILDRDVFIVIWIAIFSAMALYLLGKFKLPHDSDLSYISIPRLIFTLFTLGFVIYLIPGLFGAPLKSLSGLIPPMSTHDFNIVNLLNENQDEQWVDSKCEPPKYETLLEIPHGIKGYFDLQQALKCGIAENKPVFIDFTGHGCTNCREMEANVWSDPQVLKKLKEQFVVVALYVDERTELDSSEAYTSDYDNKLKNTIGKKNFDIEKKIFLSNAQPYYCLVDHSGKLLVKPKGYDLDVRNFLGFLDIALKEFRERKE
jgi:thiol:disulfide interchange protein DsbD